jgi:hypothetical protein
LFPDRLPLTLAEADKRRAEITDYVRTQMEPEEMVDLWNVVFPADWNVWYNELEERVVYNLEQPWYTEN